MPRSRQPKSAIVQPGRAVYGADVGVILLDTEAPRAVGDVGNARTFDFPVLYTTAIGAAATQVVERAAAGLLDTFVGAARALVQQGARAVSTSCGFVAIYQRELTADVDALVATSSLLQIPLALRLMAPDARLGVITANASALTAEHLDSAGIDAPTRRRLTLIGLENTEHFYPVMVKGEGALDIERAQAEVIDAATTALGTDPAIKAFVLECANLPPYAAAIRTVTGRPVWDITTLLNWVEQGLRC
jgi:hypothetical protein